MVMGGGVAMLGDRGRQRGPNNPAPHWQLRTPLPPSTPQVPPPSPHAAAAATSPATTVHGEIATVTETERDRQAADEAMATSSSIRGGASTSDSARVMTPAAEMRKKSVSSGVVSLDNV